MEITLLFLGGPELMVVLLVVLLLFGSKKIPELAKGLGKGMREFKDATQGIQQEIERSANEAKEVVEKSAPSESEEKDSEKSSSSTNS